MSDHPAAVYRSESALDPQIRVNKLRAYRAGKSSESLDELLRPLAPPVRLLDLPVEMHREVMSWVVVAWAEKSPGRKDIHAVREHDFNDIWAPARACPQLFSAGIQQTMAMLPASAVFNLEDRTRYSARYPLNFWFLDVLRGVRFGLRDLVVEVQLGGFYGHLFVPRENEQQTSNALEMLDAVKGQFPKLRKLRIALVSPTKDYRQGFPDLRPYYNEDDMRTPAEHAITNSVVNIIGKLQQMSVERVEVCLGKDVDNSLPVVEVMGVSAEAIGCTMENRKAAGRVFGIRKKTGDNDDDEE